MTYRQTVTVADKVVIVRTPNDIVLLRTSGETREFEVPSKIDLVIRETKSASFPATSSWLFSGVADP